MTVSIGKISHQPGGVMDSLQKVHEVPYSWNKTYAPVGEWNDPWRAFFSYAGGKAHIANENPSVVKLMLGFLNVDKIQSY